MATATYSDTTSSDVSDSVTWTSDDLSTATVTPTGSLSGVNVGQTTITATKDGVTSNTVSVEVSAAVITAISVTPPSVSVAKGQQTTLMATATYSDTTSSDVSDSVTWTSDDLSTATVTPTGSLSGVNVGQTTITATKDGVTSNTVSVEVSAAVITAISVTPPSVSVAKGQLTPLMATATYSDTTSSDVSDSVTWTSDDLSTATVTPTGFLSGVNVGQTTITATKDGVTSNTVSVEVYRCTSVGASCIDLFDTGNGKLFTNSPSKLFLFSIGGSANNGFTQEIGTSGPAGDFFWFSWDNANRLCSTYSNEDLAGRTNWRLATKNELKLLFNTYGNMFNARGWPVRLNYWSSESRGPGFFNIDLRNGGEGLSLGEEELYASCVSVP
ncbi:Ig-like domain-containing protein [Vibrio lentus]|uniref:Ig-like domain-containing protein n=1 Tax=Vibrio lentus TaxID=136468 RepID=UPI00178C88C4|nr:Ig-like domain-containing protein [Vibrio lentus]MDN3632848.1 Ig-like domain-containing protein [Vibrio lentus]